MNKIIVMVMAHSILKPCLKCDMKAHLKMNEVKHTVTLRRPHDSQLHIRNSIAKRKIIRAGRRMARRARNGLT